VYARIHTLESTAEQYEEGLKIIREQLLPHIRESTGFRGMIGLSDRAAGIDLVITLWADEESLQASAKAGDRLSELTAANVGATRLALEQYEAELFDV
jgi:hypothetical protein